MTWLQKLGIGLAFTLALGLMFYPWLSNAYHDHQTNNQIELLKHSPQTNKKEADSIRDMQAYNERLASGHARLTDPFDKSALLNDATYEQLGNMTDAGVMGYVSIPAIRVNLPIYHGTSDAVLEKGVGHLQGTSLPIGGASTHSVLTGHTGLSQAKLFTDLSALKVKDVFYLHVMGKDLAYQVTRVDVVLPNQLDKLQIVPQKDLCTLVTCTPYGINSHRLLVTGRRIAYRKAKASPIKKRLGQSRWMASYRLSLLVALGVFGLFLLAYYIKVRLRERSDAYYW